MVSLLDKFEDIVNAKDFGLNGMSGNDFIDKVVNDGKEMSEIF